MSNVLTLDVVDQDGAIREAMEEVGGDSRADFLRKAALAGGGLVGGGALLGLLATKAEAGGVPPSDVAILNFALTLEFLEAEFYTQATQRNRFQGKPRRFAVVVGEHERTHVAFLRQALGSAAVKKPKFNFKNTTTNSDAFVKTAIALEDTGVKAYLGQVANIKTPSILAAAGTIVTVEARHAAWIREIAGNSARPLPAPAAFDAGASKRKILAAVKATGFIVG